MGDEENVKKMIDEMLDSLDKILAKYSGKGVQISDLVSAIAVLEYVLTRYIADTMNSTGSVSHDVDALQLDILADVHSQVLKAISRELDRKHGGKLRLKLDNPVLKTK